MIVLTVALVSLAQLMAITLRMQMLGRNQTAAIRVAQDKIDELMPLNFTNAQLAIGGSLTADDANHFDSTDPLYRVRWTVAAGPADPGVAANSVRILTVRVIPLTSLTAAQGGTRTRADNRTATVTDITTLVRCWPCA
jgi:hypothetical protein